MGLFNTVQLWLTKVSTTGIPRNSRLIRRTRPSRISKYREFRNLYNLGKEALNFVVFGHFLDKMVKLFEPFCKLSKQNQ